MGHRNHRFDWVNGAECIGNVVHRNQKRFSRKQRFVFFQDEFACIVAGNHFQHRALFETNLLPGNDIGMVFNRGNQNFLSRLDEGTRKRRSNQINRFRRAPRKDDFGSRCRIEQFGHLAAGFIEGDGRLFAQAVNAPSHGTIFVTIVIRNAIDNGLRLLRGGRVIEVNERLTIDFLAQYRKILAQT